MTLTVLEEAPVNTQLSEEERRKIKEREMKEWKKQTLAEFAVIVRDCVERGYNHRGFLHGILEDALREHVLLNLQVQTPPLTDGK